MIYQTLWENIAGWFFANIYNIILSAVVIIFGWIIYLLIKKQLNRLSKRDKIDSTTAKTIQRIFKIVIGLVILSAILFQFVETIGLFTSLFTLMGGTIIGFAAINTIGNVIAGFIIMASRPFTIDDYIVFKDRIAKVEEIKLIFTLLIDLDGVKISVPNQKLLTDEIEDLGKKGVLRRSIVITADYGEDRHKVEKALLEACNTVQYIIKDPKPFVRVSNFQNFAVEYRLFIFIKDISFLRKIEADLRGSILDTMIKYNIDISTPNIIKSI